MGQDPDTIRQQIAGTRAEMDETIDALGYKADVPARAKDSLQSKVDAVTDAAASVKDKVVGQAGSVADAVPDKDALRDRAGSWSEGARDRASAGAGKASSVAQQNPIGLAIGAVALGFLGGLIVPVTKVENEQIGPIADQIKDQARSAGHDAVERGKTVAHDVAQAASDAVDTAVQGTKEAVAT